MFGRSCWSLLVTLFLIVPLALVRGQSDRINPAPEFSLPLPGFTQPPGRDPTTTLPLPVPPVTIGFPPIARAAGTIFAGTVTTVARHPATGGEAIETVAITFHVDNAIRGATPGETITVLQWMGLWSSGQRYRIGERVLLFLYPPSKLGLTSCVAASLGRFRIDPVGRVLLSAEHLSAFRTDPVLGGRSRVSLSDFALAVRRATEEE
jgi:hypothetical protein